MSAGGRTIWWSDSTLHVAAALSLLATIIHLWVMPEHFEEWSGYGTFFVVVALAQGCTPRACCAGGSLLLFGVAGNLTIVILWLVTRTSGIPLLGPHAGDVERR